MYYANYNEGENDASVTLDRISLELFHWRVK